MPPASFLPALPLVVLGLSAAAAAQAPPGPRRAELVSLVRQDCGACHGGTLKGGLGPSLEPAALAGKDAEQLSYVILNGRRGTAMPPWARFVSEAEAQWIVEQLKHGFPK
jgi:cytochrome c55X